MPWLLNLVGSGIFKMLGDSILGPILGALNKRADVDLEKFKTGVGAERDVVIAQLQANAMAYQEQTKLATLRWGWWGTRYLLLAAALPPIVHSGAIYLDSTFRFGWAIARAPGVYEGQELSIIAAIVGYQVTQTAVGGFVSWLHTRKA